MLATRMLDKAAQPQQMDNAVQAVSFRNNNTTLAQKKKNGSDFKDILAPKLEEKEKGTLESIYASIEEFLDIKYSNNHKPGEAAKKAEALLKLLRNKKAVAGEMMSAGDRSSLMSLFNRLEEFIKRGLKQGITGEKDNFKRLRELSREILFLITANNKSGDVAGNEKKSEENVFSLASGSEADLKKENPFRFKLVDLRKDRVSKGTAAVHPTSKAGQKKAGASLEFVSEASENSRESISAELKADSSRQITRPISFQPVEFKGGVESGSTSSGTFQRLFIPEIVQQSRIILKDGGKGEIRLILKPESLGKVRIRINIKDNSIEGRILVENNIVRELFEGNLEHLKNALRSEGFDTTALDVAVSGEKSGRDPVKDQEKEGFPSMNKEGALDEFERSMPLVADLGEEDLLIDLVV